MIIITDGVPCGCGCEKDCDYEQKMKQAYDRAITSVNKVRTPEGEEYVPDGEGTIVLPLGGGIADLEKQVEALETSQETQDAEITAIKAKDTDQDSEINAIKAKDTAQDSEISAIKAKDTAQDSDLSQLKISDAEHTDAISSLETASDAQARKIASIEAKDASQDSEISAIKTKNTQQDTEIDGLSKSVVSDLVATFDNDSRKLSLSIEREQAASIDAVVTIPAGSTGGGDYSAGDGIEISSSNVISVDKATVALKTDISDMETKTNANATFAKKTDISDMETKTNANATFATKTTVSALQNAVKPAVKAFSITENANAVTLTTTALDDSTKISETIPAVTSNAAGVVTPAMKAKWDAGGSGENWIAIDTLFSSDNLKIGSEIILNNLTDVDNNFSPLIYGIVANNPAEDGVATLVLSGTIDISSETNTIAVFGLINGTQLTISYFDIAYQSRLEIQAVNYNGYVKY